MVNSEGESQHKAPVTGDFQTLIDRARKGDRAALNELFVHCRPYLLFIANQRLDNGLFAKIGASDIVQETMMVAHNKFRDFHGCTRDDLLKWLRGILVNDLRATHRHFHQVHKRQVEREHQQGHFEMRNETTESRNTPGTQASVKEESQRLNAAICDLPADYQLVLKLRNWQQLPFADIGAEIGKSADASRKLWARAVIELEKRLNAVVSEQGKVPDDE